MKTGTPFDILVIGAGPAGILSAVHAASCAAPPAVGLIDRKKEPGIPVRCGEAIGLKGFESFMSIDKRWVRNSIVTARLVSPSGIAVTLPGDFENYILDREIMERDMVSQAVDRGVSYIPDTTIVKACKNSRGTYDCHADSGEVFTAPCLILADGVESKLARNLGWNTTLAPSGIMSCAFTRLSHQNIRKDVCDFFVGQSIAPGGYAWVFPRAEHEANVGLGVIGSLCGPGMPRNLLLDFIKNRFPGAQTAEIRCGGVPIGPWLNPLVKEGVMLVGDAARMVHCISGAGIAYSFFSGIAAGKAAALAFRKSNSGTYDARILKNYEKQWASHFGKQQKRSHALKQTINGFSDAFLDELAGSLVKIEPGRMNISRVFMKAFSKHPLQLLKVLKLFG